MAATLKLPVPAEPSLIRRAPATPRDVHFDLLEGEARGRSLGMLIGTSFVVHAALVAAIVILPLFVAEDLVAPSSAIRAFFVAPATITPPPPPPPPPAPGLRTTRKVAVPTPPPKDDTLRAPVEIPSELPPEPVNVGVDLGMVGGVEGGVEGGVAGGVAGGVVGGLVGMPGAGAAAPEPVRVGGNIKVPKLVRRVEPVYPQLARSAHVEGMVIVEARVDDRGEVVDVHVLRGRPLLDEAALEAVRQWRYQPLLLNGQRTPFILVVTVNFNLTHVSGSAG
jgi:protein TonB